MQPGKWLKLVFVACAFSVLTTTFAQTFTIGVSNGFIGSEWRTQMLRNMEDVVRDLAEQGIDVRLVVESADVDIAGQIQQLQNLMNRGVDAIIVNPNDQTALNLALEDAVDEGIVVISVDQEVSAQGVVNVAIDQKAWAMQSARWLAEELGGEGRIILIEGFVGHPANEMRMEGVMEVLAEYPGIEVLGRESGYWDQATAQGVASDLLAAIPQLDAVWTQDGMAQGVWTAVRTANPSPFPIGTGEAIAGYLRLWNDIRAEHPDFSSYAVCNPPGQGASGLRVAVELLMGGEVDEAQLEGPFGNTLYVPIPCHVDEANFEEMFETYGDFPDTYVLDGIITQEEAAAFMRQ
jgi:ribose transport system substrate-binding protein